MKAPVHATAPRNAAPAKAERLSQAERNGSWFGFAAETIEALRRFVLRVGPR